MTKVLPEFFYNMNKKETTYVVLLTILFSVSFLYLFVYWTVVYIIIIVLSVGGWGIRPPKNRNVKLIYYSQLIALIASLVLGIMIG